LRLTQPCGSELPSGSMVLLAIGPIPFNMAGPTAPAPLCCAAIFLFIWSPHPPLFFFFCTVDFLPVTPPTILMSLRANLCAFTAFSICSALGISADHYIKFQHHRAEHRAVEQLRQFYSGAA